MKLNECPVKSAIDVIGGKWKPLILFALKSGPMRHGELRRFVEGPSQKVFTEQLRQLESAGVISRDVFESREPHVEYRLSPYGETMRPMLSALAEWGSQRQAETSPRDSHEYA